MIGGIGGRLGVGGERGSGGEEVIRGRESGVRDSIGISDSVRVSDSIGLRDSIGRDSLGVRDSKGVIDMTLDSPSEEILDPTVLRSHRKRGRDNGNSDFRDTNSNPQPEEEARGKIGAKEEKFGYLNSNLDPMESEMEREIEREIEREKIERQKIYQSAELQRGRLRYG
jgi:hypothetical protein